MGPVPAHPSQEQPQPGKVRGCHQAVPPVLSHVLGDGSCWRGWHRVLQGCINLLRAQPAWMPPVLPGSRGSDLGGLREGLVPVHGLEALVAHGAAPKEPLELQAGGCIQVGACLSCSWNISALLSGNVSVICRHFPQLFLKNCHNPLLKMNIIPTKLLFHKTFL